MVRGDNPFNRHVSLAEEHDEVPVLLVDVFGSGPDPRLGGNCNSGGVVLKDSAMDLGSGEVDADAIVISIIHQIDQEDIFSRRLRECDHLTLARAETNFDLQFGSPSDGYSGIPK